MPLSVQSFSHRLIMEKMFLDTITTFFLIRSSSNFQLTRSCVKSKTSLNYSHICPFTWELPALEGIFFGTTCIKLLKKSLSGYAGSQVSDCCPLGYLFWHVIGTA